MGSEGSKQGPCEIRLTKLNRDNEESNPTDGCFFISKLLSMNDNLKRGSQSRAPSGALQDASLALFVVSGICRALATDAVTNLTQLDSELFRPVPLMAQYQGTIFSLLASAEQGNAQAQDTLASLYVYGRGVTQDFSKAVEWFTKSANQGFPPAQHSLGICYKSGLGVSSNRATADEWFQKAADQDYTPAVHEAALIADRKGNRTEALDLLRQAAEHGFPSSEYLMGCIASDPIESYVWHSLAGETGLECASRRAEELRLQLSKEQLAQADERRKQLLELRQQLVKQQIIKAQELLRKMNEKQTTNSIR